MQKQRKATVDKQQPVSRRRLSSKSNKRINPTPLHTEEQLRNRIAFEKMLARTSQNAVKVNSLDQFLKEFMEDIGTVMDVSRAFLCISHPPTSNFTCTS